VFELTIDFARKPLGAEDKAILGPTVAWAANDSTRTGTVAAMALEDWPDQQNDIGQRMVADWPATSTLPNPVTVQKYHSAKRRCSKEFLVRSRHNRLRH
jgi:hypothetical protein